MGGDRRLEVVDGAFGPACELGHLACPPDEAGLLGLVGAQLGRLQVGGLGRLRSADVLRTLGRDHIRPARPGAELVGVRIVAGGPVGVVEVGCDHLGHLGALVGEGRSQVLGGPQVAGLALGSRQHVVGDGADERLGERVLAPLG